MLTSLSLDPFVTPLVTLALEVGFLFVSTTQLITVTAYPREALKHPAYLVRTLMFILLTIGTIIWGFLIVSPLFAAGQIVMALILGVLIFRFWPSIGKSLNEGPISEAVWGGALALIGLVVFMSAIRPFQLQGALAGLVVCGLGIAMMVSGIRKLSAGE
jgi:hypothetical protein